MPKKYDSDATNGEKVLKLFRKLLAENRKHYLSDLAENLNCSSQTIMRLIEVIEREVGINLVSGKEKNRRWYQIRSSNKFLLDLDSDELRFIAICKDLAAPYLPAQMLKKVDTRLLALALATSEDPRLLTNNATGYISFYSKGYIDYSNHYEILEKLYSLIDEHGICIIEYSAAGKNTSKKHKFAPKKFVAMSGALYCIGAILKKDSLEVRHITSLAVHRIKNLYEYYGRIDFELPELSSKLFGLFWNSPKKYTIKFNTKKSADYVKERIWSEQQEICEHEDGTLTISLVSQSDPEVMAWIRSFGSEANLISKVEIEKERV